MNFCNNQILFCQNKWMELFPSIVSKARTIQVINHGAASGHLGSGSLVLVNISCLPDANIFNVKCEGSNWEGFNLIAWNE
jgi:hypothetical protein